MALQTSAHGSHEDTMLAATYPTEMITWRDWRSFGDTPVRDAWRWFVPHVVADHDDGLHIVVVWLWEIEIEAAIVTGGIERVRRALGR